MSSDSDLFLLSKSMIPQVRPNAVNRPRLLEMLDHGWGSVAVVVAPAGWGKTTLLAEWARTADEDEVRGWLALDDGDQDPVRFWGYLITSLRQAGSKVGESALAALAVPGLDPADVAIPRLLNDLVEASTPHTVILDDFHTVETPSIANGLEYLINYLPSNARVVIGARLDPPLPLALWRAQGRLTEIRAEQLRFDTNETARLIRDLASLDLDSDTISGLVARTEGWVAGLQLTALAARGADDAVRHLNLIGGEHSFLHNYVLTEVVTSLTDDQRDFILRSSVLERMSAALCDAALEIDRSEELLNQLEHADPFLTRVGAGSDWFQYHALVREAMRRQLALTRKEDSHLILGRAADWHLDHGDAEQAVRYLIVSDTDRAGELLLQFEDTFLDRGQIGTFLALADSLGSGALETNPCLGVAMAWADGTGGSGDRVVDLLNRVEAAMTGGEDPPNGWATLAGSAAALRATYGHDATRDIGLVHARRAVELERDRTLPGYAVARMALGLALSGRGDLEEALPHLREAWKNSDVSGMPVFARLPMAGLLLASLISAGHLDEAHHVLEAADPIAHRVEQALGDAAGPAVGSLRLAEARLDLTEGNLERARRRLAKSLPLVRLAGNPSLVVRNLTVQAEAELAAGHGAAAQRALKEARDIASGQSTFPAALKALREIEERLGRSAADTARAERRLAENLTDRELSILRALAGPLTQREIGRELYLSINTVKGYTKSLYRKLGVASRADAVEQARRLELI